MENWKNEFLEWRAGDLVDGKYLETEETWYEFVEFMNAHAMNFFSELEMGEI